MSDVSAALATGLALDGRYVVERLLGRGGMGEVYAARRRSLDDLVAIKRLLPTQDTPNNRQRFAIEAQAAAHIRHPNVVRIFDYGVDAAVGPYLVMELLEGPTLAALGDAGRLPIDRALAVFTGVCAAIEAGHRRGIVHRDVKPANVIVTTADDGRELVKVLDFGLAVDLRLAERNITTPGTLIGTVAYMAPEQTDGRPASPATDVFALGVLLYELVTGALPFAGDTAVETLLAISGGRFADPRAFVPDLPARVVAAIEAALARDPAARPSSPERLAQLARGDAEAAPPPPLTAPPRARRVSAVTAVTRSDGPQFTHFVGRETEVATLEQTLAETRSGRPPVAVITGDAGIGKSRLAERLATTARRRAALVLAGRFYAYAGSRPPPLEAFLAMIADRTRPAASEGPWTSLDLVGAGQRWTAFAAITDELAGQAAGRPLVIVLDDLHCATRLDLELLDHVHRTLGPRGALIVGTARLADAGPDFAAWRASKGGDLREVPLAGFGEAEVRAWLEGAFHGLRVPPIETRQLLRASGGNPFALVEIARQLVSRGELVDTADGWRLALRGDAALPASVAAMVSARLDELAAPFRAILEYAAVLGDEFRVATLTAATGVGEAAVDDALDAALALRLLSDRDVSVGNDLRFATSLVRQCVYDQQPARARRRAHRAVVDALAAIYGTADDRFAHIFAAHHHAIGAWPEAFGFAVRAAAEAAAARGELDLAHAAVTRADHAARELAATGAARDPHAAARLELVAGTVATALGDAAGGAARLERAAALAPTPELAIDAHVELARNLAARGELVAGVAVAERAAASAAAAGDRARALAARTMAADIGGRAGLVTIDGLDALVAECEAEPDRGGPALLARALLTRGWRRMKAGRFADADDDLARARALARARSLLEIEQRAVSSRSAVKSRTGDLAGSHRFAEQALVMARRLGDRRREAIALANLGEGAAEGGDPAQAQVLLDEALRIFVAIGDRACEGDCRVNLGRTLLALGRTDEAVAMLTAAAAMCARASRVEYEGIARMLLGEAHRTRGDLPAAAAELTAAVDLLRRIDLNTRWRAELDLARVLVALDEPDRARDHATRARDQLAWQRTRLAAGTATATLDAAHADAVALLATLPPP
ncbi:MAG: protein kinase [Saprospiraceae bacterium]|nr:protein kinase [Candidatus Vicinibacter affinis]